MNIRRKDNDILISPDSLVTVKLMGNITEVRYMTYKPNGCPIEKIDASHYVDKKTGEIKEFKQSESRIDDTASVAQSLKRLRDLINANITNPNNALWVTLTYAENMTDTKRLYMNFHAFWKRFLYYLKKQNYPKAEYIISAEPQERGAWHLHCLWLFPQKAPFIPNSDVEALWKHGFTKTKGLKDIDNVGLYLTAYLGDMELDEAMRMDDIKINEIKKVNATNENGDKQKKAVVKGARLALYPKGFNIYRHSRGIKLPTIFTTTEKEAQKIINGAPQVYEKTIALTDDEGEVKNIINYRQYNKCRKE